MIVQGIKRVKIATEFIHDKCSSCGKQNSIQITVFQKYFHLFWIPFIPVGKTAVSECSHCRHVLLLKEFPANLKSVYATLKQEKKTPVWTFSGVVLATVLITWAFIAGGQKKERNAQLLTAPAKGDIYEIKLGYKQYTLYKVDRVTGDSVFVLVNQFETSKVSGLSKLKREAEYIPEPVLMLKQELKSMLEEGEINDIDRD